MVAIMGMFKIIVPDLGQSEFTLTVQVAAETPTLGTFQGR